MSYVILLNAALSRKKLTPPDPLRVAGRPAHTGISRCAAVRFGTDKTAAAEKTGRL